MEYTQEQLEAIRLSDEMLEDMHEEKKEPIINDKQSKKIKKFTTKEKIIAASFLAAGVAAALLGSKCYKINRGKSILLHEQWENVNSEYTFKKYYDKDVFYKNNSMVEVSNEEVINYLSKQGYTEDELQIFSYDIGEGCKLNFGERIKLYESEYHKNSVDENVQRSSM